MNAPRGILSTEVQYLKGVGPKMAPLLNKLGLNTIGDVLWHFPRRYEDRTHLPPISSVRPGQWVTVRGRLGHVDARPVSGGRVVIKAMLIQERHGLALVWFNQPWVKRKLEGYSGELIAYGQVKEGSPFYEIASPEYELLDEEEQVDQFARIVPVYALTEGLPQSVVRRAIRNALDLHLDAVVDSLPATLLKHYQLRPVDWCLKQIHSPESEVHRQEARRRLVFEEFFVMQMALAMKRAETAQEAGIAFPIDSESLWAEIATLFPFTMTGAQHRVIEEIWKDMQQPAPMNRLVQGDVGSGKTAVAACAILAALRAGYQAALMAPTEILAEQHARNLRKLYEPLGVEVELLVGKVTGRARQASQKRVQSGEAKVVVGTHAVIQEGVAFANLGFVVIDEQHRFGVLQRAALREKGLNPDVLVMTATPIPRTLTMTLYGDLDLSVIDELPPGRYPIKTHWRRPSDRTKVYEGVRKLIEEGRQAYFVCPMVSENEKVLAQAAEELYQRLANDVYPDLKVGLLHGQMKPKEKEAVMESFRNNETQVLVATTVIEVGVDVANASVMVIEDAHRFGLSQLHQLRGRVGRGPYASYCILIADTRSEDAEVRMNVMVGTTDGFKIAEEDLKLRGPGELAGTRQSGNIDFKLADLVQDGKMLEEARQAAMKLVRADPRLDRPEHRNLRDRVQQKRSEQALFASS